MEIGLILRKRAIFFSHLDFKLLCTLKNVETKVSHDLNDLHFSGNSNISLGEGS